MTASVRDNLGTVVFTDIGVDVDIANSSGSLPPIVDLIYPMSRDANGTLSLTSTSTIRLEANATDPDGALIFSFLLTENLTGKKYLPIILCRKK